MSGLYTVCYIELRCREKGAAISEIFDAVVNGIIQNLSEAQAEIGHLTVYSSFCHLTDSCSDQSVVREMRSYEDSER